MTWQSQYSYVDSDGQDVDIYVLDTGVNIEHEEFEGRSVCFLQSGPNFTPVMEAHSREFGEKNRVAKRQTSIQRQSSDTHDV